MGHAYFALAASVVQFRDLKDKQASSALQINMIFFMNHFKVLFRVKSS